ncbi:hypothetical protein H6501_03925 [Candidatus Woesearchaeota archaeon]|nr:hypothetical protein [Nanoarchaeota archaeon]MCB9370720.1 hypothetical protein [Candidatus Woesearchaeota archaeon]USN43796.1 MAG: hypothetical protein H6500_05400 [Candidatus Woesearchaeota archaeon]
MGKLRMQEEEILEQCKHLLEKVGTILEKGFYEANKALEYKDKACTDYLTRYDKEVNHFLKEELRKNFPNYSIITEEEEALLQESEYSFYVDPLDGTKNFAKGIPIFMTGISLAKNEEVILSITHQPITKDFFWAIKGKGAYHNGKRVSVSEENNLEKVDLDMCFSSGNKKLGSELVASLHSKACARSLHCAHYGQANVARGACDVFVSKNAKPWDYCHYLLVLEAGGKVTDFQGKDFDLSKKELLCTNAKVHAKVLELIQTRQQ